MCEDFYKKECKLGMTCESAKVTRPLKIAHLPITCRMVAFKIIALDRLAPTHLLSMPALAGLSRGLQPWINRSAGGC